MFPHVKPGISKCSPKGKGRQRPPGPNNARRTMFLLLLLAAIYLDLSWGAEKSIVVPGLLVDPGDLVPNLNEGGLPVEGRRGLTRGCVVGCCLENNQQKNWGFGIIEPNSRWGGTPHWNLNGARHRRKERHECQKEAVCRKKTSEQKSTIWWEMKTCLNVHPLRENHRSK